MKPSIHAFSAREPGAFNFAPPVGTMVSGGGSCECSGSCGCGGSCSCNNSEGKGCGGGRSDPGRGPGGQGGESHPGDFSGDLWANGFGEWADAGGYSDPPWGHGEVTPQDPPPRTAAVSCPCDTLLEKCKACIDAASRDHDTPRKRNAARNLCLINHDLPTHIGPCGDYLKCVYDYEQKLTDSEKEDYRKRCPPYDWHNESPLHRQCCVRIICRYMNLVGGIRFPLIEHCAVEKIDCNGYRSVWEATPYDAAGEGMVQVAGGIRRINSLTYMQVGANGPDGNVWSVSRSCADCYGTPNNTEPGACAKMNDDLVQTYPGKDAYVATRDNCNAFAAWVENQVLGTNNMQSQMFAWCADEHAK